MTYLRHRHRLVQESVIEDLRNTLIACRWMAGTTSRAVVNPSGGAVEVVTTDASEVYPLLEGRPLNLIDYFPNAEGSGGPTPLNTLAVNQGEPGEIARLEMGNGLAHEQPYTFGMAFYAVSDAVALAVFSALRDRYRGALVDGEVVPLFNFYEETPALVVPMEVESFDFYKDSEGTTPSDVHLFFAELLLTDLVDV